MKFSGLKLAGERANSSSKSRPNTFCSSTPTGETGKQKSVLLSPRWLSLRKQKPAPATEIIYIESSPSSNGHFSTEAQWEADRVFQLFDKDGDEQISCYEFESVLRRLGELPNDEEVTRMVSSADINSDGFISLEELERLTSVPRTPDAGSHLIDAFNVFDTDRDGKISVYELRRVFVTLGDEECTLEECLRMIRGVDRDGDDCVSFEDFVAMMTA